MSEENFADIGKVDAIARLFEGTPYKPFSVPVFETAAKAYVSSASRLFLEGIDFDLVYFPLKHLGYKCITAVTGELYAAFSHPRSLTVRLGISAKLDFPMVRELWTGMVSAATEHGYAAMDLDLVPSANGLSISVSASGETSVLTEKRRPEPKSKDLICVSGNLGGAYFGQRVLDRAKAGFDAAGEQPQLEKYKMMVASYLKPEISPDTMVQMERQEIIPSKGYLVSTGLSDAIKRLSRDTGLGAKIYAGMIPFEGNSFELGKELDIDPVSAAMNGGDDYRLLYVIPILRLEEFRRDFQTFDIIGHLALPEVGTVLVTPEGVELPLRAQGWKESDES